MLKALVQLFAEKFLQSKYPDIAYQCGPSTTEQHQTVPAGNGETVIAPYSGWAIFKISGLDMPTNTWFRLENSTRRTCFLINTAADWKWATIPVQKGDTIEVDIGKGTGTSTLIFVRNESSK